MQMSKVPIISGYEWLMVNVDSNTLSQEGTNLILPKRSPEPIMISLKCSSSF
jgi:hypothetical protein